MQSKCCTNVLSAKGNAIHSVQFRMYISAMHWETIIKLVFNSLQNIYTKRNYRYYLVQYSHVGELYADPLVSDLKNV